MNPVLPSPNYRIDLDYRWPWWKFGLRPEALYTTLHERFNTRTAPIQDPTAFLLDVRDCSESASDVEELFSKLTERRDQRVKELENAWNRVKRPLIFKRGAWRAAICPRHVGAATAAVIAPRKSWWEEEEENPQAAPGGVLECPTEGQYECIGCGGTGGAPEFDNGFFGLAIDMSFSSMVDFFEFFSGPDLVEKGKSKRMDLQSKQSDVPVDVPVDVGKSKEKTDKEPPAASTLPTPPRASQGFMAKEPTQRTDPQSKSAMRMPDAAAQTHGYEPTRTTQPCAQSSRSLRNFRRSASAPPLFMSSHATVPKPPLADSRLEVSTERPPLTVPSDPTSPDASVTKPGPPPLGDKVTPGDSPGTRAGAGLYNPCKRSRDDENDESDDASVMRQPQGKKRHVLDGGGS